MGDTVLFKRTSEFYFGEFRLKYLDFLFFSSAFSCSDILWLGILGIVIRTVWCCSLSRSPLVPSLYVLGGGRSIFIAVVTCEYSCIPGGRSGSRVMVSCRPIWFVLFRIVGVLGWPSSVILGANSDSICLRNIFLLRVLVLWRSVVSGWLG